jgi:hypothetical protein
MHAFMSGGTHLAILFVAWESASTSHLKGPRLLFASQAVFPGSQSHSLGKRANRSGGPLRWTYRIFCLQTTRESTSSGRLLRRGARSAGLHRLFSYSLTTRPEKRQMVGNKSNLKEVMMKEEITNIIRTFNFIKRSDGIFIWANIFFLMVISLIPFSTALIGDYPPKTICESKSFGRNLIRNQRPAA